MGVPGRRRASTGAKDNRAVGQGKASTRPRVFGIKSLQSTRGWNREAEMSGDEIDMRMFARRAGANVAFSVGSVIFNQGDPGSCMYIVQSGVIEMVIGDKVIEICGPNEAIGFMSMVDGAPRSSTARVKEACELSLIDQRKFRFMVDEVPNFALYIMGAMARRIRGMSQAM
jgi:CRP/FNR family cyclic AMP-dependent transcriptional regulator